MNKQKLLKILNPILFIVVLFQMVVTILFKFFITDVDWLYDAHNINGMVFFALVIIHIVLNFDWIKAQLKKKK